MTTEKIFDIDSMPRGGPEASWLDRRLQTDRLEYLYRDDHHRKRVLVRTLDRAGRILGRHKKYARITLGEVADVSDPKILELGSGHGGLSRALLKMHPTAHVTVTDIEPTSVAAIAAGELGRHPRAMVREMDASAIDAPDKHFDLAVFPLSFHHLPPPLAARVFAEGTRVADKLLIIDIPRQPSLLHAVRLACTLPLAILVPSVHDGCIASLGTYSRSALRALARYADPAITLELRGGAFTPQIVVASRLRSNP
jgi:SAM-dependent methyltransferase